MIGLNRARMQTYVIRDASMNASPPRLFPARVLYIDPSGDHDKHEYYVRSFCISVIPPHYACPGRRTNLISGAISVRGDKFFFFIRIITHRLD